MDSYVHTRHPEEGPAIEMNAIAYDSPTADLDTSPLASQPVAHHDSISNHSENERLLDNDTLPRYAQTKFLSRYIPEADPNHERAQTFRVKMAKRSMMLYIQQGLAYTVVLANISFTIWAFAEHRPVRGIGTLMTGDCTVISRLNAGLHLLLNIVSSLFLGAGNYCMQILVAPSRAEIDAAHRKSNALDVGIPSFHNFRAIARARASLWLGIGITATALHLFWNSAIFASIPFTVFPVAIVTADFLTSVDDWSVTHPIPESSDYFDRRWSIYDLHLAGQGFTHLNNTQCIQQYLDPLNSTADLILVSKDTAEQNNGSSLLHGWISGSDFVHWQSATRWVCVAHEDYNWNHYCSQDDISQYADSWKVPSFNKTWAPIEYCLAGPSGNNAERCGFHYSAVILVLVCVLTLIESIFITWTAKRHDSPTMVTTGDAIAEFLKRPEHGNDTLLSSRTIQETRADTGMNTAVWRSRNNDIARWFHAVDGSSCSAGALLIGVVCFIQAVLFFRFQSLSISLPSLWRYGFGKVNPFGLVSGKLARAAGTAGLLSRILFANSFQLLVSLCYLFLNRLLTAQVATAELFRFLKKKKPLRVSSPEGMQRSSYMLSLPWRFAAPAVAAFILLHWLVSGSVFVVQTSAYSSGPDGQRIYKSDASRIGFSPIGILFAVCVGVVVLVVLISNSFRTYGDVPKSLVLFATNSREISTFCTPSSEDTDAWLFPVSFGIVSDSEGERVTFSSDVYLLHPLEGNREV
ncbi:uncharacterized protein BKCO1_9000190 [Diplodia corticola]|uniref:DUF6536 domain-containing protein n=1 Tax=Diplodia corticola TaxID=236234 RepID=A0A1J9R844_9PEZI|nr:uncharacterized protein BKCO1_9000190 [Diplodia corticola]OJD36760.1 hypothetical protein BKCO1_9000190 [Diplodia corticola]